MKNKIITSLLLISIGFTVYSQQNEYIPNKVIPPSPTAASLGTYGDVPVSYYTGTPNISIPLYEIKTNNHSLPITLSYNSSSVRVAQDASWVGLGWSLNAGGVITRSIRGIDDFDFYQGYYHTPNLPPTTTGGNDYLYGSLSSNTPLQDRNFFMSMEHQQMDGEPDLFYYNFGNYSGNFVLGKNVNGSPVLITEKNDLRFEYNITGENWIATTPDGYRYYFNTKEVVKDYSGGGLSFDKLYKLEPQFTNTYKTSVSAWYLDSIESVNGEKINFTYNSESTSLSLINCNQSRYDLIRHIIDEEIAGQSVDGHHTTYRNRFEPRYSYNDSSRQLIYDRYLQKIEFQQGSIEFVMADREDIQKAPLEAGKKPQRLASIMIYNKEHSLLKEFLLGHDYFDNQYSITNTTSAPGYYYRRLMLKSVTEYDKNGSFYSYLGTHKNPYLFEYNDPNGLPSKYSSKVDHWGFYNPLIPEIQLSYESYQTLLPTVILPPSTLGNTSFPGIDREADPTGIYSKKGMLTSITYPTKGKTVFEFEPNQYNSYSEKNELIKNSLAHVYADDFETQLTNGFTLNSTTTVKFSSHLYATYALEPINDGTPIAYLKQNNNICKVFSILDFPKSISLPAGNYTIEIVPFTDYSNHFYAYTESSVLLKKYNEIGPGNRIKTIKNYDSDGIEVGTKNFTYVEQDGNSSGILLTKLKNHYTKEVHLYTDYSLMYDVYNSAEFLIRSSSSVNPLSLSLQSSPLGYHCVTVFEGKNKDLGSTKYNFYNLGIGNYEIETYTDSAYPLPMYLDPINGKQKSIQYFDKFGNSKQLEEFYYTEKDVSIIKGIKIYTDRPDIVSSTWRPNEMEIKYYDNISKWYALTSKVVTKKFNGIDLTITEEYNYDSPNNKNITKTQTTNSEGEQIITTNQYPSDHPTGTGMSNAAFDAMIAKNIKNPVIKQETKVNNNLIATQVSTYKDWDLDVNNDGIPDDVFLPEFVKTAKGTSPLETRLEYLSYYPNGNVKEVAQKDGTHIFYIWGYDNQYPVAKVENATEVQISGLNLNMGILNSNTSTEAAKQWEFQKMRDGLPQAMVSTYTYKPLVGITSMTDPKGYSIYYEYDSANRLKQIKDQNGKIISANQYHYKQ